eukprot:3500777-Lingulodinium_polyedra.AAC.1
MPTVRSGAACRCGPFGCPAVTAAGWGGAGASGGRGGDRDGRRPWGSEVCGGPNEGSARQPG